ncbi:MAG: TrkH family potassium uptake protein [Prevotella sp.]
MKKDLMKWLRVVALRLNVGRVLTFGLVSAIPQRRLILGYAAYSVLGMFLLSLPFASRTGISMVDHLFCAVSALSTTGLSTLDVSADYTFFGQLVILLLIQVGGLGYMTVSSFVMLGITHHLGAEKYSLFTSQFTLPRSMHYTGMVRNIVGFTMGFELLGVVLLYPYFLIRGVEAPLWSAVFHTVSAFCTAGFSTYPDNLMQFRSDVYVNVVIMMLCYMGAMGFIMMTDIKNKIRNRHHKITFTTRIILRITLGLSLVSALHLYYAEPSIQSYPWAERMMVALFHAVSGMTTAGFNTVDMGTLVPISLVVLSLTMYIGASPSGTGGGLKSTTLSAIYAYTKNKLGLRTDVSLMGNVIPAYRVETALTTFTFYTFILVCGIYLMTLCEPSDTDVMKIAFEASSALATTGLSSGLLSWATVGSKLVLILLMFIGRVGVVSLGNALLIRTINERTTRRDDLAV